MAERKLASVQYVHDVAPIEGADRSMTSRRPFTARSLKARFP